MSDVTDTRCLSRSSAGLAIEVRVNGADLAGAQAFTATLEWAIDDTGRTLIPTKAAPAEFTTLEAGTPPGAPDPETGEPRPHGDHRWPRR